LYLSLCSTRHALSEVYVTGKARRILRGVGSAQLAVVLMGLAILLVFAGTWAQIDMGIHAVLDTYFRAWIVWVPVSIFTPRDWPVPIALPLPAGYAVGSGLLVNLLAAMVLRFRLTLSGVGVLLIHLSLVLLLGNEAVTSWCRLETQMPIYEGESVNWSHDLGESELAVIDHADPTRDRVIAVPESVLLTAVKHGKTIRHPDLPFDIRTEAYFPNARYYRLPANAGVQRQATAGLGLTYGVEQIPRFAGSDDQSVDQPAAIVSFADKSGNDLGRFIVSGQFQHDQYRPIGQDLHADGTSYTIYLRFRRYYLPHSIRLEDFKRDLYVGTNTPRSYSSDVQLIDPERDQDRRVKIYMNHPLRYRGRTFFQSGWISDDRGTVLQVVRNPAWTIPYLACVLASVGMLIHFGVQLIRFLRKVRP